MLYFVWQICYCVTFKNLYLQGCILFDRFVIMWLLRIYIYKVVFYLPDSLLCGF